MGPFFFEPFYYNFDDKSNFILLFDYGNDTWGIFLPLLVLYDCIVNEGLD